MSVAVGIQIEKIRTLTPWCPSVWVCSGVSLDCGIPLLSVNARERTWQKNGVFKEFYNLLRVSDRSKSKSIEILVLSACKTAQGDKRAALGLAGIAVRAGARSTLATLWSVDDRFTADIISKEETVLQFFLRKARLIADM